MKKPWAHQKMLEMRRIADQSDILNMIKRCDNNEARALIAVLYLTAARISEVVSEEHLKKKEGEEHTNIKIDYPGIRRKDIYYKTKSGQEVLCFNIQNRKNRIRKRKEIPVLVSRNRPFINEVITFMHNFDNEASLFPFKKSKAYKLIRKYTSYNCHWLRHIRLTHLAVDLKFRNHQLKKYAGWTDSRPSDRYVMMDTDDIIG